MKTSYNPEERFADNLFFALDHYKHGDTFRFALYYGKAEEISNMMGFKWYAALPIEVHDLSNECDEIFEALTRDEDEEFDFDADLDDEDEDIIEAEFVEITDDEIE